MPRGRRPADHRLVHERCDALGSEPLDRLLEGAEIVPRDPLGLLDERRVALAVGHADDARADPVRAVERVRAADQEAPARGARDLVEEAGELARRLDRVAAAARQEHLRAGLRGESREPVGELERGPRREVAEDVEGVERRELTLYGCGDLRAAVPAFAYQRLDAPSR